MKKVLSLLFALSIPSLVLVSCGSGGGFQPSYSSEKRIECDVDLEFGIRHGEGEGWILSSGKNCIKLSGRPMELPSEYQLYVNVGGNQSIHYMSDPDMYCNSYGKDAGEQDYCSWNKIYYDKAPFEFVFTAREGTTLNQHLAMVRVVHNGEHLFYWDSTQDESNTLTIPKSLLKRYGQPNWSEMEIRVTEDPASRIEGIKIREVSRERAKLREIGRALKGYLKDNSGDLYNKTVCLVAQAEFVAESVSYFSNLDNSGRVSGNLSAAEEEMEVACKDLGEDDLLAKNQNELLEKVEESLEQGLSQSEVSEELVGILNSSAEKLIKIAEESKQKELLGKLTKLMDVTIASARAIPIIYDLAGTAVDDLIESKELQSNLYYSLAENLENSPSFSSSRKKNPPKLRGEKAIEMKYEDIYQFGYFDVWQGVPVPMFKDSGYSADPRVENLIPIIDILSFRWQIRDYALGDIKFGIGVLLTQETEVDDLGNEGNGGFVYAPEVNVAFGVFQIGVSHMMYDCLSYEKDYLRVVVGADIIKLITGNSIGGTADGNTSDSLPVN